MCGTQLAENTGCKKITKNSPSWHHRTTLSGCILATKTCIDNLKKLVKQPYLLHMFPQYGKLWPTNGWDWFRSLAPQQILTCFASCLRYCSDIAQRRPTKLCTMFGHLLGW